MLNEALVNGFVIFSTSYLHTYELFQINTYILILAAWHGGSNLFFHFLRRSNFFKGAQIFHGKKSVCVCGGGGG